MSQGSREHDHAEMLRRWMWRDFANITLGIWLLASPATLGYRSTAMVWSDVVSGGFIVGLGILTLFPRFHLARWAIGTRRVLDSEIWKAWPISDPGLGATSYMLEALSRFMGGRNRWRTMPWMVVMFGILVVPLGMGAQREGKPFWRTFWVGGTLDDYRHGDATESLSIPRGRIQERFGEWNPCLV